MEKTYTPKDFLMTFDIDGEIIFVDAVTNYHLGRADYEAGSSDVGLSFIEHTHWFNFGRVESLTAYYDADSETEYFVMALYME